MNDIALLILESPLIHTGSVQPIPVLSDEIFDEEAVTSFSCVVSGWGVREQGKCSCQLLFDILFSFVNKFTDAKIILPLNPVTISS